MLRWLLRVFLPPAVTLLLLLALWEAAVRLFKVDAYLLPSPSAIVRSLMEEEDVRTALRRGMLITAKGALLGFAASAVAGVAIGVILSSARIVERAFYPFAIFLQTVPLVAIAPLLVVWLGNGLPAVVAATFIVSVFPVIANTVAGLRSVDPALRDLFKLYRSGPFARLFKLRLPWAAPQIATGLRIAAGLAVIGAVVGELFAGTVGDDSGLGMLVMAYARESQTALLFAAVALAALLGLALFGAINIASYFALRRWHASAKE